MTEGLDVPIHHAVGSLLANHPGWAFRAGFVDSDARDLAGLYREPRVSNLVEEEFCEPVADRFQMVVYGSGDLSDVDLRSAVGPMVDL